MVRFLVAMAVSVLFGQCSVSAQSEQQGALFQWVNARPKNIIQEVQHATFESPSNKTKVGYAFLLPPNYEQQSERRYPVIYWLHGGRPGSEWKAASMSPYFWKAMQDNDIPPVIYVFPNGGRLSHYDHGDSKGEQAFLELVKHVDQKYRTIASRSGRGIEGFSQGGRGTGRYMFSHADLFCSAVPMGGGHQHEQRISENAGAESDSLTIDPPGNNTWDLPRRFRKTDAQQPRILIVDGDADFNYEANLAWHKHLESHEIPHEFITVPGAKHSAKEVYDVVGTKVMQFHIESFRQAGAIK